MPIYPHDTWLVLLLTVLFFGLLFELGRFRHQPAPAAARQGPQPLRARTPDDCQHCRAAALVPPTAAVRYVVPYAQRKSRRGRKKTIDTRGQACPNPKCDSREITDPAVHALVGYGHHGQAQRQPIQDFYCQACYRKFSARRHTALYDLKTPAACVAQVLHAVAEGLSPHAAARVFTLSETTVRSWITRAGLHSRTLHHQLLRALTLTHVQLDELRLKVRGAAEAAWLWIACDARTKLIPAFSLGPRTRVAVRLLGHSRCRPLWTVVPLSLGGRSAASAHGAADARSSLPRPDTGRIG